jgi:hypothetical protein
MESKIKNLELKKSGIFCFYLCEFLSSKFNLLFVSFLVFAVNFGSGLSGLGNSEAVKAGQQQRRAFYKKR